MPGWDLLQSVAGSLGAVTASIGLVVLSGTALARRARVDPLTALGLAALAGLALLWLLTALAHRLSAPPAIAVALGVAVGLASSIRRLERATIGRWTPGLLAWCALAFWILALQGAVVVYGLPFWYGDWYEHYERSLFFLHQLPADTTFLDGLWTLPARAPLFNAAAAALMALLGDDFATYQAVATALNTFPVLPLALLLRDVAGLRERRALLVAVGLLAAAPFAVQQELVPWSKFLSVGAALAAIHLYRLGLVSRRPRLAAWSLALFAIGVLVHYLVLVYAAFVTAHLVYTIARRRWALRPLLPAALAAAALLASWPLFLLAGLGPSGLTGAPQRKPAPASRLAPADALRVAGRNLVSSTVPYTWRLGARGLAPAPPIALASPARADPEMRRRTQLLGGRTASQASLLGNLGLAGALGLALAGFSAARRPARPPPGAGEAPGWRFWTTFVAVGIPLNVVSATAGSPAAWGEPGAWAYLPQGVSHMSLQPYVALAAVWIVRSLRALPRSAVLACVALFALEAGTTGVALVALQADPMLTDAPGPPIATTQSFVFNQLLKGRAKIAFLHDRLGEDALLFSVAAAAAALVALAAAAHRPRSRNAPP